MSELRKLYQSQRALPKSEGVPEGPQRKTMLHDHATRQLNYAGARCNTNTLHAP